MANSTVFPVNEKTNAEYKFTILDKDGNAIQPTVLLLTYFDRDTGNILNSRNAQNVFNLNDVAVTGGIVTWSMQQSDTLITTVTLEAEIHVAEWEWTAAGLVDRHVTTIRVINLTKVT